MKILYIFPLMQGASSLLSYLKDMFAHGLEHLQTIKEQIVNILIFKHAYFPCWVSSAFFPGLCPLQICCWEAKWSRQEEVLTSMIHALTFPCINKWGCLLISLKNPIFNIIFSLELSKSNCNQREEWLWPLRFYFMNVNVLLTNSSSWRKSNVPVKTTAVIPSSTCSTLH